MPAINHDFSTAVFHHRTGNLDRAGACCARVLRKYPSHAECLHLLGVIASESGRLDVAASLIARAIQAAGPKPSYCVNLGIVKDRQGQLRAAAACYRQALQADPTCWNTFLKLGRTLAALGEREASLAALKCALALNSAAEPHYELANQLHTAGLLDEAVGHYRMAIRLQPDFAEAHFNLGVTLTMRNQVDEAMNAYSMAILLKPCYTEALNNYGILLHALGRVEEAAAAYIQSIGSKPDYMDAYYNLGLARQAQDRHQEALAAYDAVLCANSGHADAHNNRGNVLLAMGHPHAAMAAYKAAIQVNAQHVDAHWNLGLTNLLLGRFREGWRGYEWRLRRQPCTFTEPVWDGSIRPHSRIVIRAEQGLGDTLQFVRFATLVKECCGHITLECQPALVSLLQSLCGIDSVVAEGSHQGSFDYQVSLLSLPRIFGTTLDSIPAEIPYLEPKLSTERSIPLSQGLSVGLVWAGNPDHKNDPNRSIAPEELAPLLNLSGIRLFSLQKGAQIAGMDDLASGLTDFADTAAIVSSLDLIISVDTSVAHLAGAMGKPVWTLLPFAADWRWLLDRTDTPWYPTMRLFRQQEARNWKPVVMQVRDELMNWRDSRTACDPVD